MEIDFNRDHVYPEPKNNNQALRRLKKQVDVRVGEDREIIIREMFFRSNESLRNSEALWLKFFEPLHERVRNGEQ